MVLTIAEERPSCCKVSFWLLRAGAPHSKPFLVEKKYEEVFILFYVLVRSVE